LGEAVFFFSRTPRPFFPREKSQKGKAVSEKALRTDIASSKPPETWKKKVNARLRNSLGKFFLS